MGSCDTTGCHTKTECTTKYSSEYCCQATIFKSNVILTTRDYNYVKLACPYDIQRQEDYCYIPNGTTGTEKKMCGTDMLVCSQSPPQDGVALEEVMVVVTVVTHTAQHIAEAQLAVIQTVTKA